MRCYSCLTQYRWAKIVSYKFALAYLNCHASKNLINWRQFKSTLASWNLVDLPCKAAQSPEHKTFQVWHLHDLQGHISTTCAQICRRPFGCLLLSQRASSILPWSNAGTLHISCTWPVKNSDLFALTALVAETIHTILPRTHCVSHYKCETFAFGKLKAYFGHQF